MDFIQATRHIFPFFKFFAIIPFEISGPPCQRQIHKNRKCFIIGNVFLAFAFCFMIYQLWVFSNMVVHLMSLVKLFGILMILFTVLVGSIEILRNNHKYIQIYLEFMHISDSQPNCREFFEQILYFFIFKISYFTVNFLFEYIFLFINMYYNNIFIKEVFAYASIEIFNFALISHFHLSLISSICILKSLNSNLLNFQFNFNSFNKLFNLLNKINSIYGLNLLIKIMDLFVSIVASIFQLILSVIYSTEHDLVLDVYILVIIFNYFFQYLFLSSFLVQLLKREVWLFIYLFVSIFYFSNIK